MFTYSYSIVDSLRASFSASDLTVLASAVSSLVSGGSYSSYVTLSSGRASVVRSLDGRVFVWPVSSSHVPSFAVPFVSGVSASDVSAALVAAFDAAASSDVVSDDVDSFLSSFSEVAAAPSVLDDVDVDVDVVAAPASMASVFSAAFGGTPITADEDWDDDSTTNNNKEDTTMSIVSTILNSNMSDAEARRSTCSTCGRNISYTIEFIDGRTLCEDCADGFYVLCSCCERFVPEDKIPESIALSDDEIICPVCIAEQGLKNIDINVHQYHYKPEPIFHGSKKNNQMYFGLELEADGGAEKDNDYASFIRLAQDITLAASEDYVYMKQDSSINGVEAVWHPATLEAFCNEYPLDEVCDAMINNSYTNPEGRAGVHLHVSRNAFGKDDGYRIWNISKMVYMFDKFWDELVHGIAQRNNTHYCFKPELSNSIDTEKFTNEDIEKAVEAICNNHYCSINLQNKNTVEFRIFSGTTEAWRIRGYAQLIYTMFKFVEKKNFKQLKKVTSIEEVLASDFSELNELLSSIRYDEDAAAKYFDVVE